MIEYSEDILKQIFPIGTIVEYKEGFFKELEEIYIMENLIGTHLYKIVAEKENINLEDKTNRNIKNVGRKVMDIIKSR